MILLLLALIIVVGALLLAVVNLDEQVVELRAEFRRHKYDHDVIRRVDDSTSDPSRRDSD